jgi:hypothetical protein
VTRIVVGLAVGIVIGLAACSINHKSDSFACEINTDCESGRVCSGGFCVVAGSQIDAPKGDATTMRDGSTNNCPSQCSSCNVQQKTCTINCMMSNCQSQVVCPAGYRCEIQCNTDGQRVSQRHQLPDGSCLQHRVRVEVVVRERAVWRGPVRGELLGSTGVQERVVR